MSAMAQTAGLRCIVSMPRACTAWRWRRLRRAPSTTRSATKGYRPVRSPRSSGRTWTCRVVSIDPADADEHFGWIGGFFRLDAPASSALTRERLGWNPTHPGLIEDLDRHYFERLAAVGS